MDDMMCKTTVIVAALGLLGCSGGEGGEAGDAGGLSQGLETSSGDADGGSDEGNEMGDAGGPGDGDGDGEGDPGDGDGDPGSTGDGDGDGDGTGDGDGDSSGGEGDGDPGALIPCEVPEIALQPVMPHVVLVLDKSGSMISNTWDHDADPQTAQVTRWRSLHSVVETIVSSFDDQFEFGAQLFPAIAATDEYNPNACMVSAPPEVLVAPNNGTGILLGIPTGTSLNIRGGTPTAAGMTSALDHLIDIDDGDPAAIVLVTDGAANCRIDAADGIDRFETYDPNLLGIVQDAYIDLGIPTYVVGIDIADVVTLVTGENNHPPDGEPDGISPHAQLNELAVAGGRPLGGPDDYYQTQNELELEAAIQAIVDDAATCTVTLDPPPPFPELVEVVIDGQTVPALADCGVGDGWAYTHPNGPYVSLELCGSYCGEIAGADELLAEYYCIPG